MLLAALPADAGLCPTRIEHGSSGADVITDNSGTADEWDTGAGNDTLRSNDCPDNAVKGEGDRDDVGGGSGSDFVYGGDNVDTVKGGDGVDDLHGGQAGDDMFDHEGPDTDEAFGHAGIDIIHVDDDDGFDEADGGPDNDNCISDW